MLDLFCGAGGFSTGFLQAGFDVVAGIDNNPVVKETYEFNHPNSKFILGDLRELDPLEFSVDVVIGSPPCQLFSTANRRMNPERGMDLVYEFLRWKDAINPRFWVMENVRTIRSYLNSSFPVKVVLNCANYGVPQTRIRCFSGFYPVPKPTHSKFGENRWVSLAEAVKESYADVPNQSYVGSFTYTEYSPLEPCKTLLTHPFGWSDGKKFDNNSFTNYRYFSIREQALVQSFPVDFEFFGKRWEVYKMIGNAVPPLMARRIAESISNRGDKFAKSLTPPWHKL